MKKWLLSLMVMAACSCAFGQSADTTQPFYKRFPTVTPFQILLSDSATIYTKERLPANMPVAFMVFSPECSHCQHEAEEILAHKDELKGIQLVMVTMHPFDAMKNFIAKYRLNEVPNLVVGKDIYYLMPTFYKFHSLPFHAMYDSKGRLLTVFEGSLSVTQLVETMKQ